MKTNKCPDCGGLGEYDVPHPLWGTRTCPEAYVNVKCRACDGSGTVEKEDDE
jgi:hypothetical protein